MQLNLVTIGNKMPAWVNAGFFEYQKRFSNELELKLIEITPMKRSKSTDIARVIEKEGELLLTASEKTKRIILDVAGAAWTTAKLAQQLEAWKQDGRNVSILIGGPEGLSNRCKELAEQSWSLSQLTLPHPLVRIIAAESLYRAYSLTINHPYHRE